MCQKSIHVSYNDPKLIGLKRTQVCSSGPRQKSGCQSELKQKVFARAYSYPLKRIHPENGSLKRTLVRSSERFRISFRNSATLSLLLSLHHSIATTCNSIGTSCSLLNAHTIHTLTTLLIIPSIHKTIHSKNPWKIYTNLIL